MNEPVVITVRAKGKTPEEANSNLQELLEVDYSPYIYDKVGYPATMYCDGDGSPYWLYMQSLQRIRLTDG